MRGVKAKAIRKALGAGKLRFKDGATPEEAHKLWATRAIYQKTKKLYNREPVTLSLLLASARYALNTVIEGFAAQNKEQLKENTGGEKA